MLSQAGFRAYGVKVTNMLSQESGVRNQESGIRGQDRTISNSRLSTLDCREAAMASELVSDRRVESQCVTCARRARMLEIRNSNLEIRNKFKALNPNDQNTYVKRVLNFRHLDFGFVSSFGFRDSDLVAAFPRYGLRRFKRLFQQARSFWFTVPQTTSFADGIAPESGTATSDQNRH